MMADTCSREKDKIGFTVKLLYAGIIFIILLFYLDRKVISWARTVDRDASSVHIFLEQIDPFVDIVSNGAFLFLYSVVLCIIGRSKPRFFELGKSLILGFILSGISVQILKRLIGRARPELTSVPLFVGPSMRNSYHSFPSGHTAVAFCFASLLSQYFPNYRYIFYLWASFVGFERIEDLKHFPSDVFIGALIGIGVAELLSMRRRVTVPQDV